MCFSSLLATARAVSIIFVCSTFRVNGHRAHKTADCIYGFNYTTSQTGTEKVVHSKEHHRIHDNLAALSLLLIAFNTAVSGRDIYRHPCHLATTRQIFSNRATPSNSRQWLTKMCSAVRRVLSVQSHVVHGYVGNRAAVFPLQLLGFDVDVINSVQFSCHTGYPKFPGQKLTGNDLRVLVQGLADNQLLTHTHLLTGYIGTVSLLREVLELRRMMPKGSRYICDPVLGDDGKFYASEDLVDIYREEVLPEVTVLTPNHFEAEQLAQKTISSIEDAVDVCDVLHKQGPKLVCVTTLDVSDVTEGGQYVGMMLSEAGKEKWLLQLPRVQGRFAGTGDLTAAMLLAWTQLCPNEPTLALEISGTIVQAVIRNTIELGSVKTICSNTVPPELKLVESKLLIESPRIVTRCRPAQRHRICGVAFDMDGTLTLPDQINFTRMRERTGVPQGEDIVPYLKRKYANDALQLSAAMDIIDEEERAASPPKLRPALQEFITWLRRDLGMPLAIVTRNSDEQFQEFLQHTGLPADTFFPVITRDSNIPNKPEADPILHCCEVWGVAPQDVLMVGDDVDDILCGKSAGSRTVAMLRPGIGDNFVVDSKTIEESSALGAKDSAVASAADYTASSLEALRRILQ